MAEVQSIPTQYDMDREDEEEMQRYSPPPPYNTEFSHHHSRKMYSPHPQDRIELRIACPSLSSLRWCLKLYCLVFGGLGTILSFLWVVFHFYVLGETDSVDLRIQRYLDISLGLVMFCSTLSLIYGGYAEAKCWMVVYTTGSMCVLILYWSWAAYTGYVELEQPAYSDEVENLMLFLTLLYFVLLVPVLLYYRALIKIETDTRRQRHCCEDNAGKEESLEKV